MNNRLIIPKYMIEFFEKRAHTNCFDRNYYPNLKILYAPENEGKCLCEMKVDESHVNVNKTLHGGLIASLVDSVSTAALYNTKIRKTGVSVNMNISYIKAAKLNENILIDSKVLYAGSKLVNLAVNIYAKPIINQNDENIIEIVDNLHKNKLIASGMHTKYMID